MPRHDGRADDQLRPLIFTPGIAPHAAGSVLVASGNTRVICAASIEPMVPRWMKEQNVSGGWITAEYSMLPYSTLGRKARDVARGKQDGRGVEIQRLIGRALRAVVDLEALGARTLWVDCDVLQADGGTRTAAITGGCVAVALACRALLQARGSGAFAAQATGGGGEHRDGRGPTGTRPRLHRGQGRGGGFQRGPDRRTAASSRSRARARKPPFRRTNSTLWWLWESKGYPSSWSASGQFSSRRNKPPRKGTFYLELFLIRAGCAAN